MKNEYFRQGFSSWIENSHKYINPYENGSDAHNEFERGWSQAIKRSLSVAGEPSPTFGVDYDEPTGKWQKVGSNNSKSAANEYLKYKNKE